MTEIIPHDIEPGSGERNRMEAVTDRSVHGMALAKAIHANLRRRTLREVRIIDRHVGMTGPTEPLAPIGKDFGLTEDEVRLEIEAFARDVFVDQEGVRLLARQCLAAVAAGPVAIRDLPACDEIFEGLDAHPHLVEPAFRLARMIAADVEFPSVVVLDGEPSLAGWVAWMDA